MTERHRNLVIAFAFAALAALLMTVYVTSREVEQVQAATDVKIYVAKKDIAPGTTGAKIASDGYLRAVTVSEAVAAPGAIRQPSELAQLVARDTVYAGEQVTAKRFTTLQEQGLRGEVAGHYRVISVAGDRNQLLVGALEPGDRVDVLGSWARPEGSSNTVAAVVLRGIRVLDTSDSDEEAGVGEESKDYTARLAVTGEQAQRLFWLMRNGHWTLQLRPPTGARDAVSPAAVSGNLLSGTGR
jgi:Flp pilus assembly protein CpaB